MERFELSFSCIQNRRHTKLAHTPYVTLQLYHIENQIGVLQTPLYSEIIHRVYDFLDSASSLVNFLGHYSRPVASAVLGGLEPPTPGLTIRRSAIELQYKCGRGVSIPDRLKLDISLGHLYPTYAAKRSRRSQSLNCTVV